MALRGVVLALALLFGAEVHPPTCANGCAELGDARGLQAKVYFKEQFNDDGWKNRWVESTTWKPASDMGESVWREELALPSPFVFTVP
jgi:hypothetical protein